MKKVIKENRIDLGNLIVALYEEVSRLTRNKRLQTVLVYLALKDMSPTPVFNARQPYF